MRGAPGPLVLLDIDGTLLVGPNAVHHAAIVGGLEQVYGLDLDGFRFLTLKPWGKTDLQIAYDCLSHHRVAEVRQEELIDEWAERAAAIHEELAVDGEAPLAAPGAHAALARLHERGARLGLVTGNLRDIALRKLALAGLGELLHDAPGGFGSDHRDRAALVTLARERAGAPGPAWDRAATVIVGDTPRDIACARAGEVHVVAVTTGPFSAGELTGADAVVHALEDLEAAMEGLGLLPAR